MFPVSRLAARPVPVVAVVTLALFMAWAAREGILARARWAPATIDAYRYRAAFREPSGDMLRFAQEAWGWRTAPGGLSLDPGASGLVRYHFDIDGPIGYARLEVWSQLPLGVNLAVEALPPAGKPVQLVCIGNGTTACSRALGGNLPALRQEVMGRLLGQMPGASYDLAPALRRAGSLDVQVRGTNHGTREAVALQEFRLTLAGDYWGATDARLLYLLPLPVLLAFAATFVPKTGPRTALATGVLLAVALFWPGSPLPWKVQPAAAELFWVVLLGCAALGALATWRYRRDLLPWRSYPPRWSALAAVAGFGVAWWALSLRLAELVQQGGGQLEPDARGYLAWAQSLTFWGLYTPLEREPMFMYLSHLWFLLAGASPVALRLFTVVLSALSVGLVYALGRRTVGTIPALAAAAVVSAHPFFIWNSTRGLREDAGLVLLLGLLIALFPQASPLYRSDHKSFGSPRSALSTQHSALHLGWTRAAIAGLLAGSLLLVRLDMLLVALASLGCAWLAQRSSWRALGVTAAVAALVVAPYLWEHWRAYGDPLYSTNLQARAFRNYEFHDRPGFPTSADMDRDQFLAGPPISWFGYYFGLHSIPDLVSTSAEGSVRIMQSVALNTLPGAGTGARLALAGLLAAGALAALFRPYRYLAIAGVVLLLQFSFLHVKAANYSHVDPYGGVDPRLFMTGFPLLTLCAAGLPGALWTTGRRMVLRARRVWPVRRIADVAPVPAYTSRLRRGASDRSGAGRLPLSSG